MEAGTEERLRQALLTLGLEDFIPLWEAAASNEVLAEAPAEDPVGAIAQALSSLLIEARVRVYQGYWSDEEEPVGTDDGLALLTDRRWYVYPPEPHRVYYVNVENLREP